MESLRTFIAVEPDEAAREWLLVCLEALTARRGDIRWVRPEHLHLTLKFLGDIPRERVEDVDRLCGEIAAGSAPFEVEFGPTGGFGPPRRPRTLWIGYGAGAGLEALRKLQGSIESALAPLGIAKENRPWSAHLTLGRNPNGAPVEGWEKGLPPWAGAGPPRMRIKGLHFFSSELTPQGPIHRVIASHPLGGPRPPGDERT